MLAGVNISTCKYGDEQFGLVQVKHRLLCEGWAIKAEGFGRHPFMDLGGKFIPEETR